MRLLEQMNALRDGRVHGGYSWAAVMADGELLCESCFTAHFRYIFCTTCEDDDSNTQWRFIGLTNSGEAEHTVHCAQCNREIWNLEND